MGKVKPLLGVIPGRSDVRVISALAGGNAEKILRCISNPPSDKNSSRYPRIFGPWVNGRCEGCVMVGEGNLRTAIPITLVLGMEEGLVLKDVPERGKSLKTNGSLCIKIGADFPESRTLNYAHQIVACYVVHGRGWVDRKNGEHSIHPEPFGDLPHPDNRKKRAHRYRRNRGVYNRSRRGEFAYAG